MTTFEKTNHSSPGKKNIQSTESQTHPQTAEERDLLEVLYHLSLQPDALEMMDFYSPEPPALTTLPPAKQSQQLPERSISQQPLREQELLEILDHLSLQEDDLELTDFYRPAPLVPPALPPLVTASIDWTGECLQGCSAKELTTMRNEIFARHGRQFKEPELQRHFESQGWYQLRHAVDQFPNSVLSQTEMHNAIVIREYQRTQGLF